MLSTLSPVGGEGTPEWGPLCSHAHPGAMGQKSPKAGPCPDSCHHGHLHRGAFLPPRACAWEQALSFLLCPLSLSPHGFHLCVLCLIHESCPVDFLYWPAFSVWVLNFPTWFFKLLEMIAAVCDALGPRALCRVCPHSRWFASLCAASVTLTTGSFSFVLVPGKPGAPGLGLLSF